MTENLEKSWISRVMGISNVLKKKKKIFGLNKALLLCILMRRTLVSLPGPL